MKKLASLLIFIVTLEVLSFGTCNALQSAERVVTGKILQSVGAEAPTHMNFMLPRA
jgi:hypothetical protein